MAEKTLRMIFENAAVPGKEVVISIPKCDDTKTGATIKAAMQTIYDNKEVFAIDVGNLKAAKFVTPMSLTDVTLPA